MFLSTFELGHGFDEPDTDDDIQPDQWALHDAITNEAGVDAFELTAEALAERSLRLRVERDRLDIAIARSDNAFERSRAHRQLLGNWTTAAQWLSVHGRMSVKAARASYRYARRITKFTMIMAAVVGGVMSGWQARRLCEAASTPERLRNLISWELWFLEQSELLDPFEFSASIEHWTEVNYADDIAERAVRAERNRSVSLSTIFGGVKRLDGNLHPVWGSLFDTQLGRITDELFRVDWARAKENHGDDTTVHHLWRTPAQRRHDALVVMAMRADAAGAEAATRRPLVTVLVDHKTVHGRVCELEDGTHLAVDQALGVMKLADIERAVWGPDDRISVSNKARVFRGAERRAVELRDRFCTDLGCDQPPEKCDIDHIEPHADGGPTCQENGRLKCPSHHDGRRADPASRPLPFEHHLDDFPMPDDEAAGAELAADLERWRAAAGVAPDSDRRGRASTQRAGSTDAQGRG